MDLLKYAVIKKLAGGDSGNALLKSVVEGMPVTEIKEKDLSGVTKIKDGAFKEFTQLKTVEIPNSVTKIGKGVLEGCLDIEKLVIPFIGDTVENENEYYLGYLFGEETETDNDMPDYMPQNLKTLEIRQGTVIPDNTLSYLTAETIILPQELKEIGYEALYACYDLKNITIPNGVTTIGEWAFEECESLETIVIPDSVTTIGDKAFSGCSSLTNITIGKGVTSIGGGVFYYCSNLKCITVADGNEHYKTIDGSLYTKDGKTLIYYLSAGQDNDVVIPYGVTSIAYGAFMGCSGLTSITIPNSVTSIGDYAFQSCSGLTSITIPDSVTEIGVGAFNGCSGLTSITIPDSVTSMGYSAFANCNSLTSAVIGEGVTQIGNNTFQSCNNLTSVVIPDSVTSIGSSAFYECRSLTSVVIPDSVTQISQSAFSGCNGLTSVIMGDSVTSIGGSAFNGCSGLTSVEIPDSVTSIGGSAFRNCSGLTELTIPFTGNIKNGTSNTHFGYIFGASSYKGHKTYVPKSLKKVTITGGTLADGAFCNCNSLTSVVIGEGVTSFGNWVFSTCTGLTNVEVLTSAPMGYSTFSECSSLTSAVIGDNVTQIGSGMFEMCSNLTSIVMGNSVSNVKSQAFFQCSSLELIDFRRATTVPTLSEMATFQGTNEACQIVVPDSLYDTWISATNWSAQASKIIKSSEYTEA